MAKKCLVSADCDASAALVCAATSSSRHLSGGTSDSMKVCAAAPTCTDTIKNGDETGELLVVPWLIAVSYCAHIILLRLVVVLDSTASCGGG